MRSNVVQLPVEMSAIGRATYSSVAVYTDRTLAAGFSSAGSADFASNPQTATSYLSGEPGINKYYVWKVARNCNGGLNCVQAKVSADNAAVCAGKIATDAPVPIAFRQYAEPATRIDPAYAKLLYERVIVFRPK
jgi:hypothetical protein